MFSLLAITPHDETVELPWLAQLFAANLQRLHVRKPGWSRVELANYVQAIEPQYRPRLVLHSHYDLAHEYGLGGIHLTEAARRAPGLARLLRGLGGLSVSASLHTLAEVQQHRRRYNYVTLSPIFNSISKEGCPSGFDLAQVQAVLHKLAVRPGYRPQVVALGGLAAGNVARVREAGFAGAAVLGSIWQSPNPAATWRELVAQASAASQSFHTGS
ncbi:thiamine phosphate synthase [Hymenobacter ginsengisoli]|uniref:Thiamine phosphate synthase n=1 Tax=Hymenobacter ginsengisoli TaxID=1051626 RepID=A0ABP8QEY4_9BACT|nr:MULTISPECIES: thiamine phosphate synthase [unclassified Hymenobacter]MBO2030260.1 thiamine phosphate synthase [Hymenobacter sp. BT559]